MSEFLFCFQLLGFLTIYYFQIVLLTKTLIDLFHHVILQSIVSKSVQLVV